MKSAKKVFAIGRKAGRKRFAPRPTAAEWEERKRTAAVRRRLTKQKLQHEKLMLVATSLIYRRELENSFYMGWIDTTDGILFSQKIIDIGLKNCKSHTHAYNIGVECANEINIMNGRVGN